ncbi:myosin heavy chain, cardiac muscle isoform isoform X2 [Pimephales promelas]|uniref:myosin heavy chain, cardiac muscle isoform isoform X2 n=1 Tax=Pimephales promelas TaxID=90988 RepID=UPI001955539E|nr:myosin heavy chain, cardiac muscle isoform isoform X2 [Pimephales promelas]
MGWIDNLLICSFFVSIYLLTQAKCGPVNAASSMSDEKDTSFVTRQRRAVEDFSGLQKDLDEMKIKCEDSYKVAKDNIDGFKRQLDDLFKQVSATKSPAKDVLNILQKFIDIQEMDAITNTERDGARIERLEKRRKEAERDLSEMKKEFSGSVEIFKRAVSQISSETLKSDKATSTLLNELKKYLEDKLKQPKEQGGIAKQVLRIVTLQIEAIELKTRLSGKYKMQVQIDEIISKLARKSGLLSDLKEERQERRENIKKIDKLIATLEKEILDLNAELSALKQTLDQLLGQTKIFHGKRTEVIDQIAKLKRKDELISRILTLQFEFMEALITAQGQKKADKFKIADLQKELEKEQDRALYLDSDNKRLHRKLIEQTEQCEDLMNMCIDAETVGDQVNKITDSTSKTAIQIILLSFEIDQLTKEMKASSSNDDLKRTRDGKLKELKAKKEELQKSDASFEKILKVISQMEEIWKLQTKDPDNLNQISNLQKDLLKLISELDDKMTAKPMLKIMALQYDVTWIREMLKTVTTQAEMKKTDLQKELDDVERTLKEKNKELAAATGDISRLQRDIVLLKKQVSMLKMEKDTVEQTAKQRIKDLEKKLKESNKALDDANKTLKEKDATLSQQITKINDLIDEARTLKQQEKEKESQVNARIAELERKLTKTEEENAKIRDDNEKLKEKCVDTDYCPELQEKYKEMQAEYNETVSKLNDVLLQKVFIIKNLIDEVEYLDKKAAQGLGRMEELEEKKKELKEAMQQLKAEGSISAKTLDVLQLLTKIWKLQENPVENSKKIHQREAKLNGLLTELQNSGEKGLELTLKIISIKESMSKLKQAQGQMQEEYKREINGLNKQIEDNKKEILLLKTNCDQSTQLKDRIQQLENEAKESQQKLKKLQKESKDKIAALEKQIKTKDQQLTNTEDKLREINAENADLVKKLNSLNDDIKKITEEKNNALQKAKEEISGLNEKLQRLENELAKQGLNLKEKDDTIAKLKELRENKESELEKAKKKNEELVTELKTKYQQLAKTEAKLKEINAANQDLIREQKEHEKKLKKIKEEKNILQKESQKEISDLKKTLEAQKQDLAKKDQKLQDKDKEVAESQKELKQEKDKLNGVVRENEKLREQLVETKQRVDELEKTIEEKKELPKEEWPKFDANTAHRRLILSKDEKEARTSLLAQPVPDTPERYDTAIAVLAKDGYNSGKHYWEIEVLGRNCYVVGAAKSSAQRKGILTYGPSAGHWVILKKRGGTLFAIADKPIEINVRKTPSVIGVQVDFKNKEVTFYDAENKYEIYKFTGNELQGKIYPYIETCSDSNIHDPPLILKQVKSIDWLKQ